VASVDEGLKPQTLVAVQGIVQATQEIVEDLGTRPPPPEGSAALGDGTPTAPLPNACRSCT